MKIGLKKVIASVIATVIAGCIMSSSVSAAEISYVKPAANFPRITFGFKGIASGTGFTGHHLGVDVSASIGTPVYAVLDGTVYRASNNVGGYGGCNPSNAGGAAVIQHKNINGASFYATYGHMNVTVSNGQKVQRGQQIGTITPYPSCGSHLHFGITTKTPTTASLYKGYANSLATLSDWGFVDPIAYLNTYGKSHTVDLVSVNIPDGIYEIEWGSTEKRWDIKEKSTADSVPVHLWSKNDGESQRFSLTRQKDNTYLIKSVHSGKTIEVKGYDTFPADGTVIQQYSTSATNDSSWFIIDAGGETYSFINKTSGKAIDISGGADKDGTKIQIWNWEKGHANQRFKLIPYVEKCTISGKTDLDADDPNCKEDKVTTTPTPAPTTPQYNLNIGYYLGVKKFGGSNTYKEGYYPNACDWDNSGNVVYPDGRDCSGDVYRLVDEGVIVLDNLCAVESAIEAFKTAQATKAENSGYKYLRAGYGANDRCDSPERMEREKITEATCAQYGLSCGRW